MGGWMGEWMGGRSATNDESRGEAQARIGKGNNETKLWLVAYWSLRRSDAAQQAVSTGFSRQLPPHSHFLHLHRKWGQLDVWRSTSGCTVTGQPISRLLPRLRITHRPTFSNNAHIEYQWGKWGKKLNWKNKTNSTPHRLACLIKLVHMRQSSQRISNHLCRIHGFNQYLINCLYVALIRKTREICKFLFWVVRLLFFAVVPVPDIFSHLAFSFCFFFWKTSPPPSSSSSSFSFSFDVVQVVVVEQLMFLCRRENDPFTSPEVAQYWSAEPVSPNKEDKITADTAFAWFIKH